MNLSLNSKLQCPTPFHQPAHFCRIAKGIERQSRQGETTPKKCQQYNFKKCEWWMQNFCEVILLDYILISHLNYFNKLNWNAPGRRHGLKKKKNSEILWMQWMKNWLTQGRKREWDAQINLYTEGAASAADSRTETWKIKTLFHPNTFSVAGKTSCSIKINIYVLWALCLYRASFRGQKSSPWQ